MANRVGPADAVTGAPSYTGRMLRQLNSVNVAGSTATRPLGARSGVRPGTPSSTVTVTTTQYTVGNHAGVLDLAVANEAGPYAYSIDAPIVGTLTAATSFIRIDILSVTPNDPAESLGTGGPNVGITYTVGTVASTQPATPSGSMLIAIITTPASGGGGPTVQWVAPYTVASGAPIPVQSLAERNALATHLGLQVKRLDVTGVPIETWNGTAWVGQLARFRGTLGTGVVVTGGAAMAFTVVEDTASAWATNVWVAPAAGTYLVTGMIRNGATGITNQQILFDNGGGTVTATSPNFTTAGFGGGQLSKYLRLTAGQAIRMYASTTYTTANDASNNNWLEIVQVGF